MAGVHGERMYGYVDRVPGLCYVATQFWHFNFIPVVPLGSYLIVEGTEGEQGMQGRRLGFNAKSLLLGYFRGWVGLAVIVLFGICSFLAWEVWSAGADGLTLALAGIGLPLFYGSVWWALIAWHRSWRVAWAVVVVASGGYFAWDHENPPPPKPANPWIAAVPKKQREREELPTFLLAGNGCLFALSLMRAFDRAGRTRAYELGALLGVDEEQMDAVWEKASGQPQYEDPSDPPP